MGGKFQVPKPICETGHNLLADMQEQHFYSAVYENVVVVAGLDVLSTRGLKLDDLNSYSQVELLWWEYHYAKQGHVE